MSTFWIGFIWFMIGFILGGCLGMLILGLCVAANNGDRIFIDE